MRIIIKFVALVAVGSSVASNSCFAQKANSPRIARIPEARAENDATSKFQFILFWKENNSSTQQMREVLTAGVAKRSTRAEWKAVRVNDAANLELVEKYQMSRMPMPAVLCVAPNGAITSVFMRQLNDQGVERALVTPAMADVTKALQDKKIVVLHIKPTDDAPLPQGAADFAAEADFAPRTTIIELVASDPAEARFLTDMKLKSSDVHDSMMVVMAPPAVLVGKFAAAATKEQIAAQLHAAGKCCDDPNCKHNQKAAQQ
jgi:hypothetical protein